jgi:hypothetical protein
VTDQQRYRERSAQEAQPQQHPPQQEAQPQQRQREAEQQRQAQSSQPQSHAATQQTTGVAQQVEAGKKSSFKAGQATITLGRAGEHNLAIEWIDVDLVTYMSARFDVRTTPENVLEVQVEQNLYKKDYSGSGSISTTVLPGAPTGTTGKLTARDTTTGEMLEVPWIWYNMGGRGPGLWATIKRLIWKSG